MNEQYRSKEQMKNADLTNVFLLYIFFTQSKFLEKETFLDINIL